MKDAYAAIMFLSYANLEAGIRFYGTTLGLDLVEDQGWAKVYRLCDGGYVGIVESRKPLENPVGAGALLSITVSDVDAWHEHLKGCSEIEILSEPAMVPGIPVYSFFLKDPAGYHLEVQAFTDPATASHFGKPENASSSTQKNGKKEIELCSDTRTPPWKENGFVERSRISTCTTCT